LPQLLATADVLVTAVGAGHRLIGVDDVTGRDAARPLAIVDLALPSDTDPALGGLASVTRVDLSTLHDTAATHTSTADLAAAHAIVRDEVAALMAAHAARTVEPTLVALRAHTADVVATEIHRLRTRLTDLTPEQLDEVERALRRSAGALLHTPTVRIKEYAIGPEGSVYAEALRALFDLDPSVIDSVGTAGAPPVAPSVVPPSAADVTRIDPA
jgi:glutamyl-tRNA reductase